MEGSLGYPREGRLWFAYRAERIRCTRSSRAVTRLAPDGTRIDGVAGFVDPVEIRIDPGR